MMCKYAEQLMLSARDGNLTRLRGLLNSRSREDNELWVNRKDTYFGKTPLHAACSNGHLEVVKLLLSSGADNSHTDNFGRTPLHYAASNGHKDVVKHLLTTRAKITCIYHLRRVANINCSDAHGATPLHLAAKNGHLEVMKHLLSSGADINKKRNDSLSPLDFAVQQKRMEAARLLMSAGAMMPTNPELASTLFEAFAKDDVVIRHKKWQRRKAFVMFLVTQKYISINGQCESFQDLMATRPLSNPIHRVFMTEDLQRLFVIFL